MYHHRPERLHRSRSAASLLLVGVLGILPAACMTVTPPPATPSPSSVVRSGVATSPEASAGPTVILTAPPTAIPSAALSVVPVVSAAPSATPTQPPIGEPSGLAGMTPELAERLDAILARWRNDAKVPGIVAGLRMPDGSVWTGAVGRAQVGPDGDKATIDTPWVIGSITKTFVAALAFQLQEEGQLSLDDPISTWLPDYPNGAKITLRMLMNHTSGIADYFWHPDYKTLVFDRPTHHWTVDEILALAAERKPVFAPGRNQEYSNTNYILVGRILEIVGGKPLAKQLRTRFFDPLGLRTVVFQGDEPVPDGAAKGYWRDAGWVDWSDGTTLRPSTSAATVVWAAGAILSSVTDMLTWEQALYRGGILSPESLSQLLTFGINGYGPGTRHQRLAGWDGYGHGGSLRGFVAGMYRMPVPNVDVVFMTNRGDVTMDFTLLASELVKAAVGRAPGTRAAETPQPSAVPSASVVPAG